MKPLEYTISQAKGAYVDHRLNETRNRVERSWVRLEPLVQDYLNGYTVPEVVAKHHMGRTEIYVYLRMCKVPLQSRQTEALSRKLANSTRTNTLLGELDICNCFNCQWIKKRIERLKRR